ncbi:MAG TPA: DUF3352 domain-containing protein [Pyrinomonadaceae bacterium]|nr:DUF3352 domain-containing protein [Pyrinomonadaceae bacterium]
MSRPKQKFLALLLLALLLISSLTAVAQKRPATPRKAPPPAPVAEPVVSFDTVLADDQYRIYSEIRNVGTLLRSQNFTELLQPLVQLAEPPKQFSTVLKWIQAHADALAGSRVFVASMPAKNTLPQFVFAIEMASPLEAKKLEAELRTFLPKLDPKPGPSPMASPDSNTPPADNRGMFAQLHIQQAGALILLSEKQISIPDLRPPRRRLLAENPNFVLTRSRFASEPVFLYVDFKAIEKEEKQQREKWAEEARQREEAVAAASPTPEVLPEPVTEEQSIGNPESELQVPPPEAPREGTDAVAPERSGPEAQLSQSINAAMYPLSMALFGGRAKYPEALGAALAFEGDSYAVRAMIVNSAENRSLPVPFMPQLASGPPLTPSSPNIFPGEVDLFVVLSLDYSQIHDAMLKGFADQPWLSVMGPNEIRRPTTPFSTFEEKAGLKVKEDLLPLLGNEIAFILLKQPPVEATLRDTEPPDNEDRRSVRLPELLPVIAVSLRDREAVKQVIPKMFESMGLKGAARLAHTEKRGDAEIVSFANLFAYAFAGDFLIFAPDPALVRRAVDSYVASDTLSSNSKFRSATRWQGRQVQGQIFLSSDLVEKYIFGNKERPQQTTTPPSPVEPLTYMLSNEGSGPVHEVHIPRSLLQMVVAGITTKANESPIFTNESIAKNVLRTITSAQETFRQTKGGSYGSVDELVDAGLLVKEFLDKHGYRIEMTVQSNRFEATAAPMEYGKTGRRSFYIDQSGILRGGDHAGGAATLSDPPVNE